MQRRTFLKGTGLSAIATVVASSGVLVGSSASASALQPHARSFDVLLKRYAVLGADGLCRVDYGRWLRNGADRSLLDTAIGEMVRQRPSAMGRNDGMAYWANLYNAITVRVILDRYPVKSIRDIKSDGLFDPKAYAGPWRTKRVTIEGKSYSLDDIEHETMRPTYKDPRVHYALNCASVGCPNLPVAAWCETTIETELDLAAHAFINSPRGVQVLAGNVLRVSSIYEWFKVDFGGSDAGVLAHLRLYADAPLLAALNAGATIGSHDYDWSLNGMPGAA